MSFDFTINFPTLISTVGLLVAVVAWLIRLEGKADTNKNTNETLSKTLAALEGIVSLHQQQFIEYRLEAAEKYVTQSAVSEIKRDVIDEIGKMERRVEMTIDRAFKAAKGD